MVEMDPIELTRKLVAFDTVNPPGKERECLEYLATILDDGGFDVTILPFGDGRGNLIARRGEVDKAPLCFTGHLDTVPLGDATWNCDPFGGEIRDGRIMGRGTSDMKAGVAAFVVACLASAEQLDNGPGVVLALTSAEESGAEGAFDMVRQGQPGAIRGLIVAEPTSNQLKIGHKGAFWLQAHVEGVTAHGSMPELGINAILRAVETIGRIENLCIGPKTGAVLGPPTLNLGRISGGLNINSVPDHCEFMIDIRSNEKMSHSKVLSLLRQAAGDHVVMEALIDLPSVYTDPAHPFVVAVSEIVSAITGDCTPPGATSYFTDAAAFCDVAAPPPCVILGPGNANMAHRTDEYCEVAMIYQATEIYGTVLNRLATEGSA